MNFLTINFLKLPSRYTSFVLACSTFGLASLANAATWSQEYAPGVAANRPGNSGTQRPDVSGVADYNSYRTIGSGGVSVRNGEGIDSYNYAQQYSGLNLFYDESGPTGGATSAVFEQAYDIGAGSNALTLDMFVSFGHIPRTIVGANGENQVIQIGVMNSLTGGASLADQFFGSSPGTSNGGGSSSTFNNPDSLYLAFGATDSTELGYQGSYLASQVGDKGTLTGSFTLRREDGTIAHTLGSPVTLDAIEVINTSSGINTNLFWYNLQLTLEDDGLGGLDVSLDVGQYFNQADGAWNTQQLAGNGFRLTEVDTSFFSSSTNLTAAEHGLSDFDALRPALGTNVESTALGVNGGVGNSGTNWDFALVPEPSSSIILSMSLGLLSFVRRRKA